MLILIFGQRIFNEDCSTIIVQVIPSINVIQDPHPKNDIASIPRSWFIWGKPSKKNGFSTKTGAKCDKICMNNTNSFGKYMNRTSYKKEIYLCEPFQANVQFTLDSWSRVCKKNLILAKSEIFLPAWICCQLTLISCENFQNTTTCYLQLSLS